MSPIPRVSIIIPAYNSARFLEEAIESVFAQTYKDYETIVIDDGSTDNTQEVLAPYLDRIQYIYQHNRGASSARNTGISHSQGEYIAFLDADDIWLPEKLSTQVEYLNNNQDIALVYSLVLWVDVHGKPLDKRNRLSGRLPAGDVFNILYIRNFIITSSVMVRRRLLGTVGLFDESLTHAEDHELWLRIASKFKVCGIDKYLCQYRVTPQSLSERNRNAGTTFGCKRRVIEKHYKLSHDAGRPISQALYRRAMGRFFFHVGKYHLVQGDRNKALENFHLSLKYSHFTLRSLKTLKYCCIAWLNMLPAIRR